MNPCDMFSTNGRFEMPDNLKSFFREIYLIQPKRSRVAEVYLDL